MRHGTCNRQSESIKRAAAAARRRARRYVRPALERPVLALRALFPRRGGGCRSRLATVQAACRCSDAACWMGVRGDFPLQLAAPSCPPSRAVHGMLRLTLVLFGLSTCAHAQPSSPPPALQPPPFFAPAGCPTAAVTYNTTLSVLGGVYFRNPVAVGGSASAGRGPSSLLQSLWCVRSWGGARPARSLSSACLARL